MKNLTSADRTRAYSCRTRAYSCRTRAYSCRTRAVLAPIFSKVDIMHENQGSHEKTSFFVKKVMKSMRKC